MRRGPDVRIADRDDIHAAIEVGLQDRALLALHLVGILLDLHELVVELRHHLDLVASALVHPLVDTAEHLRALLDQRQGGAHWSGVRGFAHHVLGGGGKASAILGQLCGERGQGLRWLLDRQVEERLRQLLGGHVHVLPLARGESNLPGNLGFFGFEPSL